MLTVRFRKDYVKDNFDLALFFVFLKLHF